MTGRLASCLCLCFVVSVCHKVQGAPSHPFQPKYGTAYNENGSHSKSNISTPIPWLLKQDTGSNKCKIPEDELPRGRVSGHKCCGNSTYNPKFQTCCMLTSTEFKIFQNRREELHVCCGLRVFLRSQKIPCSHPSTNDVFWSAPRFRNAKSVHRRVPGLCSIYDTVTMYLVKVGRHKQTRSRSFYKAKLTLVVDGEPITGRATKKHITVDQHAQRQSLKGKLFLVLTTGQLDNSTQHLFLQPHELVLRVSRRNLKKIATGLFKTCKVPAKLASMIKRMRKSKSSMIKRMRKSKSSMFRSSY